MTILIHLFSSYHPVTAREKESSLPILSNFVDARNMFIPFVIRIKVLDVYTLRSHPSLFSGFIHETSNRHNSFFQCRDENDEHSHEMSRAFRSTTVSSDPTMLNGHHPTNRSCSASCPGQDL
jgi:hypothetical protein